MLTTTLTIVGLALLLGGRALPALVTGRGVQYRRTPRLCVRARRAAADRPHLLIPRRLRGGPRAARRRLRRRASAAPPRPRRWRRFPGHDRRRSQSQQAVVSVEQPADCAPAPASAGRIRWAVLLARIYDVLPLMCPACGGEMRVLAFLTIRPWSPPSSSTSICPTNPRPSRPPADHPKAISARRSTHPGGPFRIPDALQPTSPLAAPTRLSPLTLATRRPRRASSPPTTAAPLDALSLTGSTWTGSRETWNADTSPSTRVGRGTSAGPLRRGAALPARHVVDDDPRRGARRGAHRGRRCGARPREAEADQRRRTLPRCTPSASPAYDISGLTLANAVAPRPRMPAGVHTASAWNASPGWYDSSSSYKQKKRTQS